MIEQLIEYRSAAEVVARLSNKTTDYRYVREVLQGYAVTLQGAAQGVIRDASELPYPKEVIKSVLQHCISVSKDKQALKWLRIAYVSLADFQRLTYQERNAMARVAEEERQRAETARIAEEERKKAEAARIVEEERRKAEAARVEAAKDAKQ